MRNTVSLACSDVSWRAAAALTVLTELVVLILNLYWLRQVTVTTPKPFGWASISGAFAVLLAAALMGAKVIPPPVMGTACLVFFLTYLYCTGMAREFAALWREQTPAAVETHA